MQRAIFRNLITGVCLISALNFFSYTSPKQVLADDSNQSREGLPGRRVGGGTRSGSQILTEKPLAALLPETNQSLTVTGNPTLFFYVPKIRNLQTVEFVLNDENEQTVYQKTLITNGNAGIISVNIAGTDQLKSLEVGKKYRWFFAIITNPNDRTADIYVAGTIERVNPNATVASQLNNLNPLDQVAVYEENQYWYDAIATLAELRHSRPNDTAV